MTPQLYNESPALPLQPQQSSLNGLESFQAIEQLPHSQDEPNFSTLSLHVLALLIPSSTFGVLARLGLLALGTYDGNSIFPLIYVQAVGCLIMGFAVGLKEPLSRLYVLPACLREAM